MASVYLEKDAFDLIVKPIDPCQAVQSVRLALWQSRLLTLLASKEQTLVRFEDHMNEFPDDLRAEAGFTKQLKVLDKTLHAIHMSVRLMLNSEEERSIFDLAASVEVFAKQRALDRFLHLSQDGTNH